MSITYKLHSDNDSLKQRFFAIFVIGLSLTILSKRVLMPNDMQWLSGKANMALKHRKTKNINIVALTFGTRQTEPLEKYITSSPDGLRNHKTALNVAYATVPLAASKATHRRGYFCLETIAGVHSGGNC